MGLWEERVVPRLVERSLRAPEIGTLRAEVCAGLRGEVLELGYGSGLNAPYYPPEVTAIRAVEPSGLAWRISEGRRATGRVPVTRVGLDGERLEADDASYDAVLSTFTLCTIPDVGRALAEVRRVLRPGGLLHFVDHGLAPDPRVVTWQHRLDPVQRRLAGGCHLSRDIPALVRAAGLEILDLRSEYLPGPRVTRPWTYGYLGRAAAA